MLLSPRHAFNLEFNEAKYQDYLNQIKADFPGALDFRVAETPVFVATSFLQKMRQTCDYIISQVKAADFMAKTDQAIPKGRRVSGSEGRPHFLIFDFGICEDGANPGDFFPQLVEMQGFPTLFAYQLKQYKAAAAAYNLPPGFTPFIGGFDDQSVKQVLGELLLGPDNQDNKNPHTILLELFPEKQKTRIDFLYTEKYFGIPAVCLTEIKKVGNALYYQRDGKDIRIDRIYNRLIFDELDHQEEDVKAQAALLTEQLDVQWLTHPNWFYRLSKFTLPLLSDPGIPETKFLSDYETFPEDLENYVLKPLFSFAGNGVIIDVTPADIARVPKSAYGDYILQRKVHYAPAIQTPDGLAKAEIRLFYVWPDNADSPIPICNLARLTKGNMVGVSQNKNQTWVGGSFALFGTENSHKS
ncbi:hypothetical protein SAMN05192529_11298 [Arachidicoccus rhizosphaerae]|uniref:Circularly permuted type 2 ATP-grasp protein n=1 Tax=Arachidicoccus rhizosphaerae TaxID=551991 RepID=A0A1H3ZXL2_9BACT|nr:hypothetical protein [Arachidicoccus rhizosphaerae]SEA28429.1 hypothetical protein SAMN05192529_11298 [Arachidicoccus rhizosphaerae]